jgi:hypothetical protein
MFNAYVIEVAGSAAGIVTRDGRGFRFHAAKRLFNAIDGQLFRGPTHAAKAARDLASRRRPPRESTAPLTADGESDGDAAFDPLTPVLFQF